MSESPRLTGPRVDVLDISAFGLEAGGGSELSGHVAFEPFDLAGHSYGVGDGRVAVDLQASAPPGGLHVKIAAEVPLEGPCWRCLAASHVAVAVDTHTYHEYAAEEGDDLCSDYVADDAIEVARWLRDCVAESMPQTILCQPVCAGICGGCGVDLNVAVCTCPPTAPDPRWGPLADLAEKMDRTGDDA